MKDSEAIQTGPTIVRPPEPTPLKRSTFLGLPSYPVPAGQPSFEKVQAQWLAELVVGATLGFLAGCLIERDWPSAVLAPVIGTAIGMAVGLLTALLMQSPRPSTIGGLFRTVGRVALVAGFLGIIGFLLIACAWIYHALTIAYVLALR